MPAPCEPCKVASSEVKVAALLPKSKVPKFTPLGALGTPLITQPVVSVSVALKEPLVVAAIDRGETTVLRPQARRKSVFFIIIPYELKTSSAFSPDG